MTVMPNVEMDMRDWPMITPSLGAIIAKSSELMQVLALRSLRRYRKQGLAGRMVQSDEIEAMEFASPPEDIRRLGLEIGPCILDMLERVGVSGVTLSASDDDRKAIVDYWTNYGKPQDVSNPDCQAGKVCSPEAVAETVDLPAGEA